jgi:hypothetical protein
MAIKRIDGKETVQYTLEEYDGLARPAELVIDLETYSVFVGNTNGDLLPIGGGGGNVVSIPPVYFTALSAGNNQTFSDVTLSAYRSNTDITAFHNGVLLENTLYTLSGSTLTVNINLSANDTIEIIRQFAPRSANAAISIPPIYFVATTTANNQTFTSQLLTAYTSNLDITAFHNGVFLENTNYTLSGNTLTVNIPLTTNDTIDIARQFAANVVNYPVLSIPPIYFTAPANGTNQTFSNVYLASYTSNLDITAFHNGVLLENENYTLSGNTITIAIPLVTGDTVELIRQFASEIINVAGGDPAGIDGALQYNDNGVLGGIDTVRFDNGNLALGNIANIKIYGGEIGQVIGTDGNGDLTWTSPSVIGFSVIPAMNFTAATTGNNQSFSNINLLRYTSNLDITLFMNGSLLESGFYTLSGSTLTVTTSLDEGDSIDITSRVAHALTTIQAYEPGDIIKVTMLNSNELGQSASTSIANTGSYQSFASYSYTPKSNASYLIVEYVTAYALPGTSGEDDWYSQITVNNNEIGHVRQSWTNNPGGGTRSGVLFPVTGRYTNAGTDAKSIQIKARSGTSNDTLTIYGDTSTWLKITEIAR